MPSPSLVFLYPHRIPPLHFTCIPSTPFHCTWATLLHVCNISLIPFVVNSLWDISKSSIVSCSFSLFLFYGKAKVTASHRCWWISAFPMCTCATSLPFRCTSTFLVWLLGFETPWPMCTCATSPPFRCTFTFLVWLLGFETPWPATNVSCDWLWPAEKQCKNYILTVVWSVYGCVCCAEL